MHLNSLFDQFLKERRYLKNVSPKTITWYETAWKAYKASQATLGEDLTKARLQAFVVSLRERGVQPVSCNTYIKAVNAFCRWLHQEEHLPARLELSCLKTEKRVIATLHEAHIRSLISFRPKTRAQWRVHALACMLLDTGCRIDELLGLEWESVDMENLLVTIYGKGRKERKIPFSFELRKILYRYSQRHGTSGRVFPSRSGTKWSQRNALRSYYLLLKRVGIAKCGFHRLRHTFATNYLRNGGDVVRLSKVLGHSQVTTTMKYLHLLTEDIQGPHQKLSPLARLSGK